MDKKPISIKIKHVDTPHIQIESSDDQMIQNKYKKLKHLEHILLRPGMFIGSTQPTEQEMFIYDDEMKQMVKKKIKFTPGLYKIFDEGIVNMRDHYIRMNDIISEQAQIIAGTKKGNPKIDVTQKYYPVKNIEVTVDITNGQITMKNSGDGIDVAWHTEENMFVPELIFGNLLTGTNFDETEERTVGGMNGLGAKLINIFSTEFIIETVDAHRGLKYTQRFLNNMSVREDPIRVKYKGAPYTQLSFKPDFKRFGLTSLKDDDTVLLMRKRVYDIAACTSKEVTVHYNNEKIEVKTFERYVDLYVGSRSQCKRIYTVINPDWEIAVCASPDGTFEQISFVNGVCTYRGGKHVDHASNIISTRLTKYATENKKGMTNITAKSVKDNMWIFINTTMVRADFDTQTKEFFTTNITNFRSRCDVSDEFIEKLSQTKVGILDKAIRLTEFKAGNGLKKTDGKKNKKYINEKAIPAIYAGQGKKAKKCVLILTEGASALTIAVSGLTAYSEEERKYYGMMPLKGKIINPKDSKISTIENNKEFMEIKQILGLKQGVDYSKSIDDLRYGRIILMTDADVDGDHIKGLGFNLFHEFWPSLLRIDGFFCSLLTPIVKAIHETSKKVLKFYSLGELDQWKQQNEQSLGQWNIKYYKGLGTHNPTEAKEIFREMKLQKYSWNDLTRMMQKKEQEEAVVRSEDEDGVDEMSSHYSDDSNMTKLETFKNYYKNPNRHPCDLAMELAFSAKNADLRKGWLINYLKLRAMGQIDLDLHKILTMSYFDFINEKLIDFSVYDNERSIPNIMDGLKPSQRKIMYTLFNKTFKKDVKVSELSGIVSSLTSYHHGNVSMEETIVGVAQDFTGSNNINLLLPLGQFGSRVGKVGKGIGKDAASSRYIFTNINPITKLIFNKLDESLYDYLDDDGKRIEPKFYVPVIPMILINGTRGIGTGWSTDIPSYNPIDVINNMELYLQNQPMNEMQPWFRGFRGTIVKVSHQKYRVTGVYNRIGPKTVEITELPVGSSRESMSYMDYKNFIEKLVIDGSVTDEKIKSKQILDDAELLPGDITVKWTLYFQSEDQLNQLLSNREVFESKFRLSHLINTSNMNLFNVEGIMTKYVNPEDILREYCDVRLKYYEKRKKFMIKEWETKLHQINERIRFISYECDEQHELEVRGRKKVEIIGLLEKYQFAKFGTTKDKNKKTQDDDADMDLETGEDTGISKQSYDYLLKMPIYSLTLEKIEKLRKERDTIQAKLDELMGKSLQAMWSDDLGDVKKQLVMFEKEWNESHKEIFTTPTSNPHVYTGKVPLQKITLFKPQMSKIPIKLKQENIGSP